MTGLIIPFMPDIPFLLGTALGGTVMWKISNWRRRRS